MSGTILVVDDNPTNRKLAVELLAFEGYTVTEASDAETAEALVRDVRPELILMDIGLPGMDGLALTRKLKADSSTCGIRIVAVTAFAMRGDEARAVAAGCDGYITKPIDIHAFPLRVAALLAKGRAGGKGPDAAPAS